jgi:hypothetical protein
MPDIFRDWESPQEEGIQALIRQYERGYAGARYNAAAQDEFLDGCSVKTGEEVCFRLGYEETAAGELVVPFRFIEERYPGSLPGGGQVEGDCFPSNTMVEMADGGEKPIQDVKVGEYVVSHLGNAREVFDTIEKPFKGELVSIKARHARRPLAATPDHRIMFSKDAVRAWAPISEFKKGHPVLLPAKGKGSPVDTIRYKDVHRDVYCLRVDEDHSFIANGYAVHNCVSWGQRNANFCTMVTEAIAGIPDEVSGKVEECPAVSDLARKNGVLSTEAIYFFRSTKPGHGWFCHEAARVSQTKAGLVLRKEYDGIDLTRYSKDTVNFFNRKSVPSGLAEAFDDNIIREATEIKTFEALRDLLARGFGIQTCGSEGFSSTRDENGVCKRSGSWAHSMAYLGVDDRAWAHSTYGGPLVLVQNSWNEYMTGPRKIHGVDLEIPRGSFWARWRDVQKRTMIAMAGANGWARKKLPDWNPGW